MKIYIEYKAWQKIKHYTDACPYEIGGLGKVTTDGKDFYVHDAEIFTQKVTPAHVDMTAETLATFQFEKMKAKESLKDYKFWWHSHAKMGVFFSSTDTDTIDNSTEFPWLVSIVTNHKHELVGRVDVYQPVHIFVDKVTIEVLEPVDEELKAQCAKDIAEKVTFPAPTVYDHGKRKPFGYGSKYSLDIPYRSKDLLPTSTEERIADLEGQLDECEDEWARIQKWPQGKKRTKAENKIIDEIDIINRAIIKLQDSLETKHETNIR